MQAEYLGDADEIRGTAAADLASGDIVFDAMGRCGVITALTGFKTGQEYRATAKGRFSVVAKTSDTASAGALIYWDESEAEATTTASGNLVMGRLNKAKTNTQTSVEVLLNSAGKSFVDTDT